MFRLPKPALAVFAGFVLVVASACGSSSSTLAIPVGSGAANNPSAGGSVAAAVNANDPNSIISAVINDQSAIKSFHIKMTLNGTIKASALAATDPSMAAIKTDLKLDGTAIEGDVDLVAPAAHLTLAVPPIQALGGVPITGDVILKDGILYYKVSLLGTKYTKTDLASLTSGLTSGLPVTVPTAGPSPMSVVSDELTQLKAQMDAAGIKATLVGTDQIGGKDAYHINISVPLDKINAAIAASSPSPAMTIDSASIDFWVYKDSSRLAKFEIKGASSALGSLDFTVTVTAYDQPVTVTAPAAADIQTTP